jgi:hypothetical protein
MLDARAAATRQCDKLLKSKRGRARLDAIVDELRSDGKNDGDVDDDALRGRAREILQEEVYNDVVVAAFQDSGAAVVDTAKSEEDAHKREAERKRREWLSRKDAEVRRARREEEAKAAQEQQQQQQRQARARKAQRQWLRAVRSNSYVSFAGGVARRVPRPGSAAIAQRPPWVAPLADTDFLPQSAPVPPARP